MKNFGIYPKLTKDYILKRISQEEIMDTFYGVPVTRETLCSNSINSKYRVDNNPSCNYYYNINGKLRFKDQTTRDNYDCFDIVAKELGISSNSKQGFIRVLNEIAKSFRIHKYVDYNEVLKYERSFNKQYKKLKKTKRLVQYKVILRNPNYHDKAYWKKGGVTNFKGIFFIQHIMVSYDNQPYKWFYEYSPKDVCYGYYGGKDKKRHINLWKFYFPIRIKGDTRGQRFYTNGSFLQGLQYIQPARIGVLTKAFKDAKVFNAVGLQSLALSAEGIPPTEDEMFYLMNTFDFLIVVLDLDDTGRRMARYLRRKYRVTTYFFLDEDKDAYAFVDSKDKQALKNIVQSLYDTYKEDIIKYEPKIINFQ